MATTESVSSDSTTAATLEASDPEEGPRRAIAIAAPRAEDGADVHDLIAACPPLDGNSLYANLLQCTHFARTCALARRGGDAVGWISGYRLPERADTYFLWQVAVHESARGEKLAKRLLADIFARPSCDGVRFLETTITPDNDASWALFRSIARWLGAPLNDSVFFDRDVHFRGRHASEVLVRIGPFETPPPAL